MLENIGHYDVEVDFDDIGIKKDRINIRYKENDVNSAKISIKCVYREEIIDLAGCDILIRTQAGENRIEDLPLSIDVENGIVDYSFPTNGLINGINHIEVMIVKGDWVKTSPKIYYRVFDGIGDSDIEAEVDYPVLINLIRDVRALNNEVEGLKNDVIKVNADITNAETIRVSNENKRKTNEETRISNENDREVLFDIMQDDVNTGLLDLRTEIANSVSATNANTGKIDAKIIEVNNKINETDGKISEVNNKLSEMNTLKTEVEGVRDTTSIVKTDTERVKNETLAVKANTETVKNETIQVKNATEIVKNNTETVKIQAEEKIVDVEGRMQTIEDTFGDLVSGTGYATKTYVDSEIEKVKPIISISEPDKHIINRVFVHLIN